MPISIDFLANTRDFLRGAGTTEQALEDVSTSLDDLARDGQQATGKLEASFRDLAEASKSKASTVRASAADETRSIQRTADDSKATMREVRSEAIANASETFSSFDGSVTGLLGGIQGTFGGLVAALGPLGMAVGAAGAIGVGLIQTALENGDTASQEFREDVSALGTALIATGRTGSAALGAVAENLKTLATEADPAQDSLTKLQRIATAAEGDYRGLAQAFAGNTEGLDRLISRTRQQATAAESAARAADMHSTSGMAEYAASIKRAAGLGEYVGKLDEARKRVAAAAEQERLWREAGGPEIEAKGAAAQAYADSVQEALGEAGESWEDYQTKQGVNLAKYNEHLEESIKATRDYKTNVTTASALLSQDALNYIMALGQDAAPLLQEFVDAPARMKGRTAANWDALGKASGSAFNSALQDAVPDALDVPVITPRVALPDFSAVDRAIAKRREVLIRTRVVGPLGRNIL